MKGRRQQEVQLLSTVNLCARNGRGRRVVDVVTALAAELPLLDLTPLSPRLFS